jgi:hypothetical protein
MNTFKFSKSRDFLMVSLSVVLSAILFIALSVQAATTISTNISTGGTLAVTGASTLTGALTTAGNSTFGDAATDVNLFTGTLQASTTALFTSGVTTYGNSTFGDAGTDTNIFTGTLQASTTALFTGAVTLYDDLTVNTDTFFVDKSGDVVSIGSSTPVSTSELVISSPGTSTISIFSEHTDKGGCIELNSPSSSSTFRLYATSTGMAVWEAGGC